MKRPTFGPNLVDNIHDNTCVLMTSQMNYTVSEVHSCGWNINRISAVNQSYHPSCTYTSHVNNHLNINIYQPFGFGF